MEQVEAAARARDADVGEPALLGDAGVALLERARVRQQPLLHAGDEDDAELESLDLVQRDQGDARGLVAHGVDVADQRDVLEELHQPVGRRDVGVLGGEPDQLEDVRPALLALLGAVLEHLAVAGLVEHALEEHRQRHALRVALSRSMRPAKPRSAVIAAGPMRLVALVEPLRRLERREALLARELLQLGDGAITDLATRRVDHARERHRVARVDAETQVREHVLDLAPVVEAQAADQLIRDAAPQEHFLEGAGLRVGAVEHGAFGERDPLAPDELLDLGADRERLLALVVDGDEPHRFTDALLGPELLLRRARCCCGSPRARCRESAAWSGSSARGSRFRIREVVLEGQDVAHVRAAEAVDTPDRRRRPP